MCIFKGNTKHNPGNKLNIDSIVSALYYGTNNTVNIYLVAWIMFCVHFT